MNLMMYTCCANLARAWVRMCSQDDMKKYARAAVKNLPSLEQRVTACERREAVLEQVRATLLDIAMTEIGTKAAT